MEAIRSVESKLSTESMFRFHLYCLIQLKIEKNYVKHNRYIFIQRI